MVFVHACKPKPDVRSSNAVVHAEEKDYLADLMNKKFPLQQRLVDSQCYRNALRTRSMYARGLRINTVPNTVGYGRLGLVVAKRNLKTAVARHRVKRVIREFFRLNHRQLGAQDVVVSALPQAVEMDNLELRNCLEKLWNKLCRSSVDVCGQ